MLHVLDDLTRDASYVAGLKRLDRKQLSAAATAMAGALNGFRELAREESRLIKLKRKRQLASEDEQKYIQAYQRFRKQRLEPAIEPVRAALDELEKTGVNLAISRHFMSLIRENKLHAAAVWAECRPHLEERRFTVLSELCGLEPELAEQVWAGMENIKPVVPVALVDPGHIPIDRGIGHGISQDYYGGGGGGTVGGGGGAHIPIQKGLGLLVQDILCISETTTMDYQRFIETNGLPISGVMVRISASRLAGASEAVWFIVGCLLLMVGLTVGGIVGALLAIAGGIIMYFTADACVIEVGPGAAGFVDP